MRLDSGMLMMVTGSVASPRASPIPCHLLENTASRKPPSEIAP
jgi:hypothetical protein